MIEGVFRKRTLRDATVEPGQTALARVDFNVPLERGHVADDTRIRAALPAIELLRERGARLVLCSHLGRPKGRDPDTSLAPASECLRELLGGGVYQAPEVIGPEVRRGVSRLEPEEVLVLENTRWEPGETRNDPELAREMAEPADLFVNDAFGAAHRTHASTVGVTRYLPAVAGPARFPTLPEPAPPRRPIHPAYPRRPCGREGKPWTGRSPAAGGSRG